MRFGMLFPWAVLLVMVTVGLMIWRQAVVVSEVETRWQEAYSAQEEQMRQANDLIRAANSRIADSNSVIKELDDRVSQQNQTIAAQRDTIDLLSTPAHLHSAADLHPLSYCNAPSYLYSPPSHSHFYLEYPDPPPHCYAPPHALALGNGQHLRGH